MPRQTTTMRRTGRSRGILALLTLATLLLAACGDEGESAGADGTATGADEDVAGGEAAALDCDQPIALQYAFITPAGSAYDVGGQGFGEYLDEHAPGCFDFESYPDGQLGNELDIEQAIQGGALQMGVGAQALQTFVDEAPLFHTPFLFNGREHMERVIASDIADEYAQFALEQGNFKVLGYFTAGDRHILSTRPIHTDEDLQGLSLRVPESRLQIDIWRELGVNSIDLPFGDLYTGLQTGTVDAIELDPALIRALSLYEVAEYYTLTDHLTGAYPLIMDANFFDGLDPALQAVLEEAGQAAQRANQEFDVEGVETSLQALADEHGVEVIEFDNTELRERVQAVYEQFPETLPPHLVEGIRALEP